MTARRVAAFALATTACGRLSFDPRVDARSLDAAADGKPAIPIAFVQQATMNVTSTSISLTLPQPQSEGNTNILVVHHSLSASLVSATDTSGNAYVVAIGPIDSPSAAQETVLFASSIAAAPSTTITVTLAGNAGIFLAALEYAGLSGVDSATGSMGSGTAMDTGPVMTTRAGDMLFKAGLPAGSVTTIDPQFVERANLGGGSLGEAIAQAAGPYSAHDVQDVNSGWVLELVAFQAQ